MKKRIIASTMASVMALGAASSLIASADNADFEDQKVNMNTLKKFLADKEIDNYAYGDGLEGFGTKAAQNFMDAYDFAKAVTEDTKIGANDPQVTVAYLAVKSAISKLQTYDADELRALVEELRPIRNTDNYLNDSLDKKYKQGDWDKFQYAFDDAEIYMEYEDDLTATTNAYEALWEVRAPKELDTYTKREMDTAISEFERTMRNYEYRYEPWQRGTVTGSKTDYDKIDYSWGALYAHVTSMYAKAKEKYDDFNSIKGWNITSNEDIVKAVNDLKNGKAILENFKVESLVGSRKSDVDNLLKQYYGQLVYTYNYTCADTLVAALATNLTSSTIEVMKEGKYDKYMLSSVGTINVGNKDNYWSVVESSSTDYKALSNTTTASKAYKLIDVSLTVRTSGAGGIYFVVDQSQKQLPTGKYPIVPINGRYFFANQADASNALNALPNGERTNWVVQGVRKDANLVLSDYIPVTTADLAAELNGVTVTANAGMTSAYTTLGAVIGDLRTPVGTLRTAVDAALTDVGTATPTTGVTAADIAQVNSYINKIDAALTIISGVVDTLDGYTDISDVTYDFLETVMSLDKQYKTIEANIASVQALLSTTAIKNKYPNIKNKELGTACYGSDAAKPADNTLGLVFVGNANNTMGGLADNYKKAHDFKTPATNFLTGYRSELVTVDLTASNYPTVVLDHSGAKDQTKPAYNANNVFDVAGEGTLSSSKKPLNYGSFAAVYHSSNPKVSTVGNNCEETTPSILRALALYENFTLDSPVWSDITKLDNIGEVEIASKLTDGKAPSSRAWSLLTSYIKYALEDMYLASGVATYSISDLENKLDDTYKLTTDTMETQLFEYNHEELVRVRKEVSNWLASAASAKLPKKDTSTLVGGVNATEMYKALDAAYKNLNNDVSAFKYSYEEVMAQIAEIAEAIDDGEILIEDVDDLVELMYTAVDKFQLLSPIRTTTGAVILDSGLFNNSGTINIHNRLFTNGKKYDGNKDAELNELKYVAGVDDDEEDNKTHQTMLNAYNDLIKAYNTALENAANVPDEPENPFDIDGDGEVDFQEVMVWINAFLDEESDVDFPTVMAAIDAFLA